MIITNPFSELPQAEAGVILADPPWQYKTWSAKGITKKGAGGQYDCQGLDWIQSLPVRNLADPTGCALILWATAPMLPEALETMEAWGFAFKSAGAWAKQSSTGQKWAFGTGYLYRSAAEFWLLGTFGKPNVKVKNVRNLIVAPVREHSRKPDQMRTEIERQWEGPYIELFARESSPNWTSWGFETEKFTPEQISQPGSNLPADSSDKDQTPSQAPVYSPQTQ